MLILEIDMGNTATKWRTRKDGQILQRGKIATGSFPDNTVLSLQGIDRIRLASVCSEDMTHSVEKIFLSAWNLNAERAACIATQAGLVNSYADPSRMGVDRWLAMLASFNAAKNACLVVSCGTALTIDFVGPDGRHGGGYILPGLVMMRTALLSGTGRIRYDAGEFDAQRTPGMSTASAVEHGAVHALVSAVEAAARVVLAQWGGGTIFVTGGDSDMVLKQLCLPSPDKFVIQHIEELVLDGLRFALP